MTRGNLQSGSYFCMVSNSSFSLDNSLLASSGKLLQNHSLLPVTIALLQIFVIFRDTVSYTKSMLDTFISIQVKSLQLAKILESVW
jgi:hypothetical protein